MSRLDRFRDLCSDLKDEAVSKASELKKDASRRYSKARNYVSNKYDPASRSEAVRQGFVQQRRSFVRKLKDTWEGKWSDYKDYIVWEWLPWVASYGLIWNFALNKFTFGAVPFGPEYVLATGITWYGIRQELPYLVDDLKYRPNTEG